VISIRKSTKADDIIMFCPPNDILVEEWGLYTRASMELDHIRSDGKFQIMKESTALTRSTFLKVQGAKVPLIYVYKGFVSPSRREISAADIIMITKELVGWVLLGRLIL
jgi:hypothetical protein